MAKLTDAQARDQEIAKLKERIEALEALTEKLRRALGTQGVVVE